MRKLIVLSIIGLAFGLLPSPGLAQTEEEGMRLFNEALELHKAARTEAQLDQVIRTYEHASQAFEKAGDKQGVAVVANNLGSLYLWWKQYDKATHYFMQCLTLSRELGTRKLEGVSLSNLGTVYWNRGEAEKAEPHYRESLVIWRELKDRRGERENLSKLGSMHADWGQCDKALKFQQEALEIARELKDRQAEGDELSRLGTVYAKCGRYETAVSLHEQSLTINRESGDRPGEAITLHNLGSVYSDWGRHEEAVPYYEKALALDRETHDRRGEANALYNLGHVYSDWGRYATAKSYYEMALRVSREIRHRHTEGLALNGLGNLHSFRGEYEEAVKYYEQCLALSRELNDRGGEAVALHNLGKIYSDWGRNDKALDHYEQSLKTAHEINDHRGERRTLDGLGLVYMDRGQYDKALSNLKRSLEICRKLNDRRAEAGTLHHLGLLSYYWGRYGEAVDYYEKALALRKELKDRRGEGKTLNNLGLIFADWGQYDKATDFYNKCLAINRELGNRLDEAGALNNLALVYRHKGDRRKARETIQQALIIWRQMKVPVDGLKNIVAHLYMDDGNLAGAGPLVYDVGDLCTRGRFYLLQRQYDQAKSMYEALLASSERTRHADNLFAAYTGLGMAYEGIGDTRSAAEFFTKAVVFTEELRATLTENQRKSFFDVSTCGLLRTTPYEGLARVLMRMDRPEEALRTSEFTKARVFAESLSKWSHGEVVNIPERVLTKDAELNDALAALKKRRQDAYEKNNKLTIEALEPQIMELESRRKAHIRMLREQYPLFAATKYPEPMDLSETALTDGDWVLSYDVTDSGILIYLTRGRELVKGLFKPIARKQLDNLVRKFREPLEVTEANVVQKLKSFDLSSGKKLSDVLLSDVLPDLPENMPVTVVPDDSLGVLPFEMLVLNDAGKVNTEKEIPYVTGAAFFGDRNPISYYQSITALTLARTYGKEKRSSRKLLVMADPVFGMRDKRAQNAERNEVKLSGAQARVYQDLMAAVEEGKHGLRFGPLPLTGNLAKNLATIYDRRCDVYTGLEATKEQFVKRIAPAAKDYGKIVFATHGYFGKDLPGIMEPVLVLTLVPPGIDGYLRMSEVMGLKLGADMVALTACQTGLGRRLSGEGVMGMGRAFQYAGARAVLMSLWSVEQKSAVDLVETFFRHLKGGKPKLEALRLARKEIRKAGYDHPFFWAGFILAGEVN